MDDIKIIIWVVSAIFAILALVFEIRNQRMLKRYKHVGGYLIQRVDNGLVQFYCEDPSETNTRYGWTINPIEGTMFYKNVDPNYSVRHLDRAIALIDSFILKKHLVKLVEVTYIHEYRRIEVEELKRMRNQ